MLVIAVLFQFRQNSFDRDLGVADQSVVELSATAELFSANVDLDNGRVPGKKLLIREIGADHEQSVAVHHREITGGKSEQAGHSDVKRIVVLDEFLAAQGMDDWRVQFTGERDQFRVSSGAACARENRDLFRIVKNFR